MRLLLNHIEFELLALECRAPPGGRRTIGRKAAGAQRPTPCEAEGRASHGAKHSKAKCSNFGRSGGGLRVMAAEVKNGGGARREDSIIDFGDRFVF